MCGIVGILRYGNEADKQTRASSLYLGATLLELTETRGKDATGVAALFDDGNFFGQKMGIRASEFITRFGGTEGDFDGLLKVLQQYESTLRLFIGHCRKKTVGGASDNMNNHPIKIGNMVGLHNGTLKNDDIIFKNLGCKRDGTVDSEAIFHLLNFYTKSCKDPFTLDMLEEVTRRLDGTYSFLAFNANNPNQLASARHDRPAEYCLIKPLKLVLIISEKKFVETALWQYNKLAHNFAVPGFVPLRDKDVEFAELKDETIALFDLTKEINEDTKLESLYDTRPIPKILDRIWKAPDKTTTYCNGYQANRSGYTSGVADKEPAKEEAQKTTDASITNTTEEIQKPTSTVVGKPSGIAVGRVWSGTLEKYVVSFGRKDNEGHVVIDTEKKSISTIEHSIAETEADTVDGVPKSKVLDSTSEIEFMEDNELDKSKDSVESFLTAETVQIDTVEIAPAIIKAAKTVENTGPITALLENLQTGVASGKADSQEMIDINKIGMEQLKVFKKFENDDEIAILCNTDITSLKQLPISFLANRILRHSYLEIFADGWKAKCASFLNDDKLTRSKKHIRVLKTITHLMDGILNEEVNITKIGEWFKTWNDAKLFKEVSPSTIKEIFNVGDLRTHSSIKLMLDVVGDKED